MNRDKNNRTHFSNALPVHRPNTGLWQRIENDLNATGANPVSTKLSNKLPIHSPSPETWNNIEKQLFSKSNTSQKLVRAGLAGILLLFVTLFFILVFQNKDEILTGKNEDSGLKLIFEKQDKSFQSTLQPAKKPHKFLEEKSSKPNDNASFIEKPDNDKIGKTEKPNEKLNDAAAVINEEANTNQDFEIKEHSKSDKRYLTGGPSNILEKQPISEIHNPFDNDLKGDLKPGKSKSSFQKPFVTEIGLFVQPFYTKNVSSLSDDWIGGGGAGLLFSARNSQVIFETGLVFSQIEFEDNFEIKYYSYQYLGSVVSLEGFKEIEEVNEYGDTIVIRQYYPEVIEFYDSTYNETEKPDMVKISKIGIPLGFGYRLYEKGRISADVKAGLEMSVVSKKVVPASTVFNEKARLLAIDNNQPDSYTVKWKYNLSFRFGCRLGNRWSVFAEPFYSKYLEQMQKSDGSSYPKPEETGVKIGISFEY